MMLDGTYTGNYSSTVTGTAEAKIYIKPKNYMAAIIDGSLQVGDFQGVLGAYTRVRNIRLLNSNDNRGTWLTPQGTMARPPNIYPAAPNIEVINCMYHDGGIGIPAFEAANGFVLYGTMGFNNGWADDQLGGCQNLYTHSKDKTYKHNVFGGAFKRSVAVYTTNGEIDNIKLQENVVFAKNTLLMGGDASDGKVVLGYLLNNHVTPIGIQMGYSMQNNDYVSCVGNRVYAKTGVSIAYNYFKNGEITGNKLIGGSDAVGGYQGQSITINEPATIETMVFDENEYHHLGVITHFVNNEGKDHYTFAEWQALGNDADGSYVEALPDTNEVFVYPNEYPDPDDKRMGMVVIWNWEEAETVAVDLTELGLTLGETYRWRQAQDPLVDIDTWEDDGNPYSFPMTGHTVALPIGFDEELVPTQFPTFGCFIIELV